MYCSLCFSAPPFDQVDADALATRDIDLRWDTRKRIIFSTQLARVDSAMLGVLKKVDASFRMRWSRKYTAVNKDCFEVGIIRHEQTGDDPHPIQLSCEDEDFGIAQARMNTLHPATFVAFKRWMVEQADRDPLKRRQDVLAFGLSVANPAQFFEGTWQGNPN